jgi:hypothetical protein
MTRPPVPKKYPGGSAAPPEINADFDPREIKWLLAELDEKQKDIDRLRASVAACQNEIMRLNSSLSDAHAENARLIENDAYRRLEGWSFVSPLMPYPFWYVFTIGMCAGSLLWTVVGMLARR